MTNSMNQKEIRENKMLRGLCLKSCEGCLRSFCVSCPAGIQIYIMNSRFKYKIYIFLNFWIGVFLNPEKSITEIKVSAAQTR